MSTAQCVHFISLYSSFLAARYIEQALSLRVNIEDYACLAQALEQQDRPQAAHDVSRKALSLLTTA